MKKRVVVTGPGGRVGRAVMPVWGDRYQLRLLYRSRLPLVPLDTEVVQGEIADLDKLTEVCREADALVHLAAVANEADFSTDLLPHNIVGAYHAFEAARRAGVRRVIYASSGQVGGGFPPTTRPEERVSADARPRPITLYACTKLWGEALGLHYAQQHGLSVCCLRMGWCDDIDVIRRNRSCAWTFVSDRDLAEAIAVCIDAPDDLDYLLSYVVSDNAQAPWDTEPLRRLGWKAQDRLEDIR